MGEPGGMAMDRCQSLKTLRVRYVYVGRFWSLTILFVSDKQRERKREWSVRTQDSGLSSILCLEKLGCGLVIRSSVLTISRSLRPVRLIVRRRFLTHPLPTLSAFLVGGSYYHTISHVPALESRLTFSFLPKIGASLPFN